MKTQLLLFEQAFNSIFNNKARSFLTMLGIAIAVFVVVAVDSISNGLAQSTNERFSNLDATRITLSSQQVLTVAEEDEGAGQGAGQGAGGGGGGLRQALGGGGQVAAGSESLTKEDVADIRQIAGVERVSPLSTAQTQIVLADESTSRVTINGVGTDYALLEELSFSDGQFFTDEGVDAATDVVVIDNALAEGLFGTSAQAIGKQVVLNEVSYSVSGVIAQAVEDDDAAAGLGGGQRAGGGRGQTSEVYIPYTTFLDVNSLDNIATVVFEVDTEDSVDPVAEAAIVAVYENHGITDDADADVAISTAQDALDTISGIAESQSKSDKFIGWIVLLVGGIGIMNIMLVTVSERTREIGLRKALGAKRQHILTQFLTESVLLTVIGGLTGLAIAVAASSQVTSIFEIQATGPGGGGGRGGNAAEASAIVDINTVLIAVGVSVLAGIIFGLYPAMVASKKDPVESLRYE